MASALLLLAGCESSSSPPTEGPLTDPVRPSYDVAQTAVDGALSREVTAYEATRVVWAGLEPVSFEVERYRRGRCFERGIYTRSPRGHFVLERVAVRAGASGGPALPSKILLAEAVEQSTGPKREGFWHQRDPLERLVWTFERRQEAGEPRPRVTQVNVRYDDPGSCTLPRSYDRASLPARLDPGTPPPTASAGHEAAPRRGEEDGASD